MPAVNKGRVLVTGCNGYIAVWVVKSLLEEGFSVRGTVRRQSSIPHLQKLLASYGDKFEVVVVPDITKDGAFDEAVKGVNAIEHTASPFHFNAKDPQEIIGPAVAGTLSVLRSALAHANGTVKRVIILSSCSAVLTVDPDRSIREVEEKGTDADNVHKYHASKTLAEQAAWKFAEENKDSVKFDLVMLNPPFVYGPFLHEVMRAEDLGTSLLEFYLEVAKGSKTNDELTTCSSAWVDVRDIGIAHVRALQKPKAGGQRIIISGSPTGFVWQEFVSIAHKIDPSLRAGDAEYKPGTARYLWNFDNVKSRHVLGLEYHTMEECTRDTLKQFKELGWY